MQLEKKRLMEAAREYYEMGFNIVLVNGKQPLHEWKQWQTQRQTLEEFENLPWDKADGYGVVCGYAPQNGLYLTVVDYDVKNTSSEAQAKGREALKHMRITRIEQTPSGGQHWVYLSNKKPRSISAYHDIAALELIGEGKIAIMAPSKGYRRLNDNPPTPVYDVESMFLDALRAVGVKTANRNAATTEAKFWFDREDLVGRPYKGPMPPCIKKISQGTSQGQRNQYGIILASYFANFKRLKPKRVKQLMEEWNRLNKPPLDQKELDNIIKSAIEHGYVYGCLNPILHSLCDRENCVIAAKIMDRLITPEERERAEQLLKDPKLLEYVVKFGRKRLIGEDRALIINFVNICSGQTKYPISCIIDGFSGSGKNESLRAIKPLIPKEWLFEFTTSTPEAIKYLPSDFSGTLLIYEVAGMESKTGTLGLRAIGEGESIITIYPLRDEVTGRMELGRAETNAKNFITTESDLDIHPDLYRRVFRYSMNHSKALTKRVIAKKLRDAQLPESLKKILENGSNGIPYSEADFQNALRINNWKAEVILFPPPQLLRLVDMAVTREMEVALRTHIEKILNFVRVLALINQKRRVRLRIGENSYVVASPEDFVVALEVLKPVIMETITRLGKRQAEVLQLFEKYDTLDKHKVAELLKVSTVTAAKSLKSLAKAGYLKEDTSTKPYSYKRLQEKANHLVILENTSEYCLYWRKRLEDFLNTTLSSCHLRGISVEVSGQEYAAAPLPPLCFIPQNRQGDKVQSTAKPSSSNGTEQKQLVFSELIRCLRSKFTKGTEEDFVDLAVKQGITEDEAQNLFKKLVDEGRIGRDPQGYWRWI
ncbi:hypothetical protein DRO19_00310 [Candidatus Bathyarchaeota archaeon]|nr:MAG: hypothetical protein DRO19_00310 [Candidatus Bathyarchaeota archaeon]